MLEFIDISNVAWWPIAPTQLRVHVILLAFEKFTRDKFYSDLHSKSRDYLYTKLILNYMILQSDQVKRILNPLVVLRMQ